MHHTTRAAKLSHEDVRNQMHASLFCLAPTGSGWGWRLKQAAMSGCIPVIIDDHVRVCWHLLSYGMLHVAADAHAPSIPSSAFAHACGPREGQAC